MKFSIGYFQEDEFGRSFTTVLDEFSKDICEIYFPHPSIQTCRGDVSGGYLDKSELFRALAHARALGIRLCMLANGNCYGDKSVSVELKGTVLDAIQELGRFVGKPDCVTTTSPYIAHVCKSCVPEIKVRASVNMRLGEPLQYEAMYDLFDEFYLAREYNYQLDRIQKLKEGLKKAGKKLHILANSGCMAHCPGQIFHDNLVAHEREISNSKMDMDFLPYACWNYYAQMENYPRLLANTWIRPEDVFRYEGIFDEMKLATRVHAQPVSVIRAYVDRSYDGNVLMLTEPSHASLIAPGYVDNKSLSDEWFERKMHCSRDCRSCGYCDSIWQQVYKMPDLHF